MPTIRMPEVRLPHGLREMRREDIQDAMPEVRMPKVSLPRNVKLPKVDIDLSKIDLPTAVEERLPGRKRRSRLPIVAAVVAVGAAAWLILASPVAPAIRRAMSDVRARLGMGGVPMEELDELDEELELNGPAAGLETGFETGTAQGAWTDAADGRSPVPVGPGEGVGDEGQVQPNA